MEKLLLNIIKNAQSPICIRTDNIIGLIDEIKKATGVQLSFEKEKLIYYTEQGYSRVRKLKNSYLVWQPGKSY